MNEKEYCECCGKEIIRMGNQKYCNNCSLYVNSLITKLSYYKNKYLKLKKGKWQEK